MTASSNERGRKHPVPKPVAVHGARGSLRAQGVRTRNAIVEAARSLLLERGSLRFTLREVAQRAGISISNLQYYFPTRLTVLRAVFEPVIGAYIPAMRRAVAQGAAPRDRLSLLVGRALRDAKDAESSALWCHFLSLVAVDPVSARMLDACYGAMRREVAHLAAALNPALTQADSTLHATLLIALVEGISMRIGVGLRHGGACGALDQGLWAAIDGLLAASPPLPPPPSSVSAD